MFRYWFIFLIVSIINYDNATGYLPEYIKVCPRSTPNIANCIINSINSMRHIIASNEFGPGFEVIPKVEPFYIPILSIGDRNDFKAKFTDVYTRGGSKFQIEKLKANMRDLRFDAIVKFPRLDIKAKYDLNFNIFGFSLQGQGDSHLVIDNSRGRITMRAKKYMHEGKEYIHFEKFLMKIQIGHVKKAQLSNIFGGGSIFKEILNTLIHSQPEFMVTEVNKPIENNLSEMFTAIANKITKIATYDEIFPE